MKPLYLLVMSLALATGSCSRSGSPDVKSSVNILHQYVNSFKGQPIDTVKRRFNGAKVVETAWKDQNLSGKQLIATYPDCELRVLFVSDKAATISIQVLSD